MLRRRRTEKEERKETIWRWKIFVDSSWQIEKNQIMIWAKVLNSQSDTLQHVKILQCFQIE